MVLPSGDQRGWLSVHLPWVNGRRRPSSTPASQRLVYFFSVSRSTRWTVNTMWSLSGEICGSAAN